MFSKLLAIELTARLRPFRKGVTTIDNCSVSLSMKGLSPVHLNKLQEEKPLIYFSLMVIVAAPAGLSGQISEW